MTIPKWKRFEELTAKIQCDLAPDATIKLNDKIIGRTTGEKREVDISVRKSVGQYNLLIAIECKDYSIPVNVKKVGETIELFEDVGVNQGVIVSANGFTRGALKRGKKAGLALYRLIDTGNHDWKSNIVIPVFCTIFRLKSFSLIISTTGHFILPADDQKLCKLEMYNEQDILIGTPEELIYNKWMLGEIPKIPGVLRDFDFVGQEVKIKYAGMLSFLKMRANLFIEREFYFYNMPLSEISGFKDEESGRIINKGFTTTEFDLDIIKADWQLLKNEDQIAVVPILRFELLT